MFLDNLSRNLGNISFQLLISLSRIFLLLAVPINVTGKLLLMVSLHIAFLCLCVLDCLKLRQPLMILSEQHFTNWIKDRIKAAETLNKQYVFIVDGNRVCLPTFCSIFGISEHKFHVAEKTLHSPTVHKATGTSSKPSWMLFLEGWFINLIAYFCDIMPNSDNRYLPIYFTKSTMHETAVSEFQQQGGSFFSSSSFQKFWKNNYKYVKIPKSFKMGICDTCLELKSMKTKEISREDIIKARMDHNTLHATSRQFCNDLRAKAKQQPFINLYFQFDGKQASHLPHITPLPKDTQNIPRVKTLVYGVSNFSNETTHFYLAFPHWSAGPNLSITILYNSILQFFKNIKHQRPAQFILQVDNCAKDGKNKTIFAFAAHLVKWNWFKEVLIVSLIQGHTHDLIDGEFSVWTAGERKWNIPSFHQLGFFLSKAFKKGKAMYSVFQMIYDWTAYFAPTLVQISQHSEARMFKFFKNNSEEVEMLYKTNPLESDWHGLDIPESNQLHGIQICTYFQQLAPHVVAPEPLPVDLMNQLATYNGLVKYYDSLDSSFWKGMQCDSVGYLVNNNPYPKEGKL
jgi:hypothetical protein